MNRNSLWMFFSRLIVFGFSPKHVSMPASQKTATADYEVELIPIPMFGRRFASFDLVTKNKTDRDIQILWDKTFYIDHSGIAGSFLFGGAGAQEQVPTGQSEIIHAGADLQKTIYPQILGFSKDGQWIQKYMWIGLHGISLAMEIDGKVIQEQLTITIKKNYKL